MNTNLNVLPGTAISLFMLTTGCSSLRTELSREAADLTNRSAEISCYSGGQLIYSGTTDGKVFSESNSDGYTFIGSTVIPVVNTRYGVVVKKRNSLG